MIDFEDGISIAYAANGGNGLAGSSRRRRRRWSASARSKRQGGNSIDNFPI